MSAAGTTDRVELLISGMTCASCARRVERKLNRLAGVVALVNFATESATVTYDTAVTEHADLLTAVEALGYQATPPAAEPGVALRGAERAGAPTIGRRLAICGALSGPVLLMAMVPAFQVAGWQWLSLALATPVAWWGAWPLHRAAIRAATHRAATMDTLASIGILAAWAWSLHVLAGAHAGTAGIGMPTDMRGMQMSADMPGMRMGSRLIPSRGGGANGIYLEVAAMTTTLVLLGRWLETRARERARSVLQSLTELGANEATVIDDDGCERTVSIGRLRAGQRFVASPGETIAADGIVEDGRSAVDTSMMTGESIPVEIGSGAPVTGGTINVGAARLVVRATRVGAATTLAQISRLVDEALATKPPVQRLADRISSVFVPAVVGIAAVSFLSWQLAGESTGFAAMTAIAVLVAACPCALGLATPIALMVGAGRGAQLGILFKGPETLEAAHRVDTIIFDKTGTLTTGQLALDGVTVDNGAKADDALRLVAALERHVQHPVARAIVTAAASTPNTEHQPVVHRLLHHDGLGVEGEIDGRAIIAGRPELLAGRGMPLTPTLARARRAAERKGRSVVGVGWDRSARALFVVSDAVKPSARQAIADLTGLGLDLVLLSGDHEHAARTVAQHVVIDEVIAGVLPDEKADTVRSLRDTGRHVAMVRDGINDAPALAAADLGLAIGTGADVAIQASDLTLISGDPRAAVDAIRLARATFRTIRQNVAWAFAYNLAVLPLAALGFLNPMLSSAAMALSSVSVVGNALRLRRFASSR